MIAFPPDRINVRFISHLPGEIPVELINPQGKSHHGTFFQHCDEEP
jgi:hypothetical protein